MRQSLSSVISTNHSTPLVVAHTQPTKWPGQGEVLLQFAQRKVYSWWTDYCCSCWGRRQRCVERIDLQTSRQPWFGAQRPKGKCEDEAATAAVVWNISRFYKYSNSHLYRSSWTRLGLSASNKTQSNSFYPEFWKSLPISLRMIKFETWVKFWCNNKVFGMAGRTVN